MPGNIVFVLKKGNDNWATVMFNGQVFRGPGGGVFGHGRWQMQMAEFSEGQYLLPYLQTSYFLWAVHPSLPHVSGLFYGVGTDEHIFIFPVLIP